MQTTADIGAQPDVARFSVRRFLHAVFMEGGRFWERGRLAYNGVLLLLTVVMLVVRRSEAHYIGDNLGTYFVFALMANILYTAAYLPEAILKVPRLHRFAVPVRWCVLIAGTVVAGFLGVAALEMAVLIDPAHD